MSAGVEVPVGIKNAGFKRGLDEMRSQAKDFQKQISSGNPLAAIGRNLGAALSLGGIAAGLQGLIDKYSKLEEMSVKYGTSAVTLQKIAGAAKEDDIEVGTLAKTLAKLTVAADKAAKSTKAHGDRFKNLGINAKEFAAMDMDQKLLALSAAYERANVNGEGAHKILGLLGAKGAAIIPLLARGPQKLNEELAKTPALGDAAVRQMKALDDAVKEARNTIVSWGLQSVRAIRGLGAAHGMVINAFTVGWKNAFEIYKQQTNEMDKELFGKEEQKQTGAGAVDSEDMAEDMRTRERMEKLEDDIAQKERQIRLEALDDDARLNAMYEERTKLLAQANDETEEGLQAKKDALDMDEKAAKLSEEIQNKSEAHQKKIADREFQQKQELKRAQDEERSEAEKNQLEAMDPKVRAAALTKKATKLATEAKDLEFRAANTVWNSDLSHDDQAATRMRTEAAKKRTEARKLQGEIASLVKKDEAGDDRAASKRGPLVFASHLAEVGGGGHASASGIADRQLNELKGIRKAIEKLAGGTGSNSARPQMSPAFGNDLHRSSGGGLRTGHL